MSSLEITFLSVLLADMASKRKECDKLGILIYEDLGCTPQNGSSQECPAKYTCTGMEPSKEHCFFRGKKYTKHEDVSDSLSYPSCHVGCYCSPLGSDGQFTCAALDCPEWLGTPVGPACYRKYELEKCCSVGQVCPPFDNIEKCVVEGKEYREGERFYPANTCLNCVCQKGFKGQFEKPFCKRRLCGQQLFERFEPSCAPFYSRLSDKDVLCCPQHWICPDGTEIIKGKVKSEETCVFGKTVVKVGQYFERSDVKDGYGRSFNKVKCECVIPPLMKCNNV